MRSKVFLRIDAPSQTEIFTLALQPHIVSTVKEYGE
jgi:hypothetical protein